MFELYPLIVCISSYVMVPVVNISTCILVTMLPISDCMVDSSEIDMPRTDVCGSVFEHVKYHHHHPHSFQQAHSHCTYF